MAADAAVDVPPSEWQLSAICLDALIRAVRSSEQYSPEDVVEELKKVVELKEEKASVATWQAMLQEADSLANKAAISLKQRLRLSWFESKVKELKQEVQQTEAGDQMLQDSPSVPLTQKGPRPPFVPKANSAGPKAAARAGGAHTSALWPHAQKPVLGGRTKAQIQGRALGANAGGASGDNGVPSEVKEEDGLEGVGAAESGKKKGEVKTSFMSRLKAEVEGMQQAGGDLQEVQHGFEGEEDGEEDGRQRRGRRGGWRKTPGRVRVRRNGGRFQCMFEQRSLGTTKTEREAVLCMEAANWLLLAPEERAGAPGGFRELRKYHLPALEALSDEEFAGYLAPSSSAAENDNYLTDYEMQRGKEGWGNTWRGWIGRNLILHNEELDPETGLGKEVFLDGGHVPPVGLLTAPVESSVVPSTHPSTSEHNTSDAQLGAVDAEAAFQAPGGVGTPGDLVANGLAVSTAVAAAPDVDAASAVLESAQGPAQQPHQPLPFARSAKKLPLKSAKKPAGLLGPEQAEAKRVKLEETDSSAQEGLADGIVSQGLAHSAVGGLGTHVPLSASSTMIGLGAQLASMMTRTNADVVNETPGFGESLHVDIVM